jgi:hypothetical protein
MLAITVWSNLAKQDELVQVYSKLGGQLVGRISISKSLSMFDVLQDLCRQASKMMPHESLSVRNLALWVGSLRLTPCSFEFKESFTKEEEQEASELLEKARRGKRVDIMWDDNYEHACNVLHDHDITWRTFQVDDNNTVFVAHLGLENAFIPREVVAVQRRLGGSRISIESQTQVTRDLSFMDLIPSVEIGLEYVQPESFSSSRVVHLAVRSCTVAPDIQLLSNLRIASIKQVDSLPVGFSKLNLHTAVFDECDAHDAVEKVSHMQDLKVLHLLNCKYTKPTIPTQLGRLVSLETLRMIDNNFSGSIPTELGLLSNLRTLELVEYSGDLDLALPEEVATLRIPEVFVRRFEEM